MDQFKQIVSLFSMDDDKQEIIADMELLLEPTYKKRSCQKH
tara:strand:+ start:3819 stop:3941 length:123 start_codon:yes stop_codon:yes gene_type:complete